MAELKSLFEYDDYREFLKDFYAHSKATNPKFSHRYFARLAGFKSSSILKEVMDGKINIASSTISSYVKAIKLNREESFFFHHLVLFNQAKKSEERQVHARELLKCRTFRKLYPLKAAQYAYLSHWYYVPIRELVNMAGFREDPQWIADKISPPITAVEVTKAIETLISLDILARDAKGQLHQTQNNLSVGQGVTSAFIAKWHREMLKKASESIDRHIREDRDITTATITVTKKSLETVKEIVARCRREILEIAANRAGPQVVYQVNFQVFPLSSPVDDETEADNES